MGLHRGSTWGSTEAPQGLPGVGQVSAKCGSCSVPSLIPGLSCVSRDAAALSQVSCPACMRRSPSASVLLTPFPAYLMFLLKMFNNIIIFSGFIQSRRILLKYSLLLRGREHASPCPPPIQLLLDDSCCG